MLEFLLIAMLASDAQTAISPVEPAAAAMTGQRAKPVTAQAVFDAATAASEAGNYDEAISLYESLEARPATVRTPAVLGIILIRKGLALYNLERLSEADTALDKGLSLARSDDPNLRGDIRAGYVNLARIALLQLNYARARDQALLAAPLSLEPVEKIETELLLARATMFDEGGKAVQYADSALALAAAIPNVPKKMLADIHTMHARAWLVQGQKREAYAELKKALAQQGGLSLKVSSSDVITRSDLAIAALLNGDSDSARTYMAYTGAGRIAKAPFATAIRMTPPPCGGTADLRPDDSAVIEFSIRDDGSVGYVTPVYASRPGPVALEFARAVSEWYWRSEDVATIPPLFRYTTRIELRCSNTVPRPATSDLIEMDFVQWLKASKVPYVAMDRVGGPALTTLKAELTRREAAGGGIQLIPILLSLACNGAASAEDRQIWLTKARDIAAAAGAPPAARTYLEIMAASNDVGRARADVIRYRGRLRTILGDPAIAGDARASSTLRLLIAEPAFLTAAPADAALLLSQVADDARLNGQDPLRVGALVRLAALKAAAGALAEAQASYARTGLEAQQCALLDARPALLKTSATSSDFPMEAMRWGFEGWVTLEYDILADGRTARPRAITAYPPFVFRDAAIGMVNDFRYSQSYRPDGAAGCSGERQGITFRIPGLR